MGLQDELGKLEYLSLVSKVCTELDNHLNMDSKDLAEFVIDLADKNRTMEDYRKALIDNGADFSGGLMRSLFDLVNRMRSLAGQSSKVMEEALEKACDPKLVAKRSQFSGLAIADDFGRVNGVEIFSLFSLEALWITLRESQTTVAYRVAMAEWILRYFKQTFHRLKVSR